MDLQRLKEKIDDAAISIGVCKKRIAENKKILKEKYNVEDGNAKKTLAIINRRLRKLSKQSEKLLDEAERQLEEIEDARSKAKI